MQVAGFVQDDGACTNIRLKQPLRKIQQLHLADVSLIEAGDGDIVNKCQKANVVVLGRAFSENVLRIIDGIHSMGAKVVFDLDDNYFDIHPLSPHYKQLGIMPVNMDNPDGQSCAMWQDGTGGFNVINNRKIRRDFIATIRAVDCITVTTEPLQREYLRYNDNVTLVPNAVDFALWEPPPIRWAKDEVRLLYTGAANHQEDFFFVKDVLADLQKKYPRLKIVFVGTDWKMIMSNLDYSRVEVHTPAPPHWVHIEAYPHLLKSLCCDIGIAPVSNTPFNNCRSSLKWVEYSALKCATVASDWGPYKRDVENGKTGLLADTPREWREALSLLIKDAAYRRKMAMNAFNLCKFQHNLDFRVDEWMNVFQGVAE